jgi:hypothetical protein
MLKRYLMIPNPHRLADLQLVCLLTIFGLQSFKSFKPTPSSGWWGAKMFA